MDSVLAARARNYRDPDEEPDALDWSDAVTRTAVVLDTFTFETPEAASGMVTGERGREQLERMWARKAPADRQLLRRRAAIALEVGAGLGAPA